MLLLTLRGRVYDDSADLVDGLAHPATSWPNSQEVLEKNFEAIPTDEPDLIVTGSAAHVYGA